LNSSISTAKASSGLHQHFCIVDTLYQPNYLGLYGYRGGVLDLAFKLKAEQDAGIDLAVRIIEDEHVTVVNLALNFEEFGDKVSPNADHHGRGKLDLQLAWLALRRVVARDEFQPDEATRADRSEDRLRELAFNLGKKLERTEGI
jgi:hypothetical protein